MNAWDTLLAVRAARLHYLDGLPTARVADALDISRFKAGRLIAAARAEGWVTIQVSDPPFLHSSLSERVAERFAAHGVHRALVTSGAERAPAEAAAAAAVEGSTSAGDVLGLACGRTVNRVVATIRRLPRCEIVQLTGLTAPGDVGDSSIETVRRAANLTGRAALPVYDAMVYPRAEAAARRRQDPHLRRAIAPWDRLSSALITVGAWLPGRSHLFDSPFVDDATRERVTGAGAVAEICCHLVDGEGRRVATALTARCLTLPWERLAAAREVTAVAVDPTRGAAVRAALRTGIIGTLVLTEPTATALLELDADLDPT